ncbi:hypothetical protein BIW11_05673, partial [Tropilaelaps mercedesae]
MIEGAVMAQSLPTNRAPNPLEHSTPLSALRRPSRSAPP